MHTSILVVAAILMPTLAVAAAPGEEWHMNLLKRQTPGTPLYDCHSSCGSGITLSRGADPCHDQAFLTAYNACLACSGPKNFDIWKLYGTTLSAAGAKCGLPTTPLDAILSVSGSAVVTAALSTTGAPSNSTRAASTSATAPTTSPSVIVASNSTATVPASAGASTTAATTRATGTTNATASAPAQSTGAVYGVWQRLAGALFLGTLFASALMSL